MLLFGTYHPPSQNDICYFNQLDKAIDNNYDKVLLIGDFNAETTGPCLESFLFRKLGLFYKIIKSDSLPYLLNLIPRSSRLHTTRNSDNITPSKVRHNFFKNSFFPSVISEWNKLDLEIRNSASLEVSKKHLLNFIRPTPSNFFNINNPLGLKLLTRLRIGFNHLKEHKFKHNFQDSVDPLCCCGNDIESTVHFFLHFSNFTTQRQTLLNKLKSINASIMTENENSVVRTLLFGRPDFNYSTNK